MRSRYHRVTACQITTPEMMPAPMTVSSHQAAGTPMKTANMPSCNKANRIFWTRLWSTSASLVFKKALLKYALHTMIECVNPPSAIRSEEHTSELQSRGHLVCRLLLEKKKRR